MSLKKISEIFFLLLVLSDRNKCQVPTETETQMFNLNDALIRHTRLKCLQQFPQADIVNFTNSHETRCYLHCFLYKTGLMDLITRGLNSDKFIDIWESVEEAFEDDSCLERFDFSEPLNGSCNDTYRKLMEFRTYCLELFEYTFTTNSTWKTQDLVKSKQIGQSASEFCDLLESEDVLAEEYSQDKDVSLRSQYKDKLKCIFQNIHYLDAYGRVDETEILLSFQEAHEDSIDSQSAVRICTHRANAKFINGYLGNTVYELRKCLKTLSPVFTKVFNLRDETSRQY